MSFIYAEKTHIKGDDEVLNLTNIYSDTKTELIGAYKSNWSNEAYKLISKYGFTKCINIGPKLSLSFAGNDTGYAHDLLNWIYNESEFDIETAINKAYEIHMSTDKDNIEFILCYADDNNETHIYCIKEKQIHRDVSSAWIGSYAAFHKLQELRMEDDFLAQNTLSLFTRAVEECKDNTVGGFIICDRFDNIKNQFVFQERLEAYAYRAQSVHYGEEIVFSRPAETGDCTLHFYEDPYDVIIEFYQNNTILLYTSRYRYSDKDTNNKNTNHFLLPMIIDAETNMVLPV